MAEQQSRESAGPGGDPIEVFSTCLRRFRPCFSRAATFRWFVVIMTGLVVRQDFMGVSSIVRWLDLPVPCYESILHFFRSTAWTLETLLPVWWEWLFQQAPLITVNSRVVLLGDHVKQPKEGRQMPDVVTMRDESVTSSRPTYFRGHHWGFIAALVGRKEKLFASPLRGEIHQRQVDFAEDGTTLTLTTRVVAMAMRIAVTLNRPAYLVLDAAFVSGPVLDLAYSLWSIADRSPMVHIISRAKSNTVAFHPPPVESPRRRGRRRKYGERVELSKLFETAKGQFVEVACPVYGQVEVVQYLCLDLLWKPVKRTLRFVLARTSRGPIILVTSDLGLDPVAVIEMYCWRTKIETMFWAIKHTLGGLGYHFWNKHLIPQARRPLKNSATSRVKAAADLPSVRATCEAIERFVNLCAITQGLLQIIALNCADSLSSGAKVLWMRTHSSSVPSEFTTKQLLTHRLLLNKRRVSKDATLRIISHLQYQPQQELDTAA